MVGTGQRRAILSRSNNLEFWPVMLTKRPAVRTASSNAPCLFSIRDNPALLRQSSNFADCPSHFDRDISMVQIAG